MKVLLINGSPREHGNTFTALSEVAKTLNEENIETKVIVGVADVGIRIAAEGGQRKTVAQVDGCLRVDIDV